MMQEKMTQDEIDRLLENLGSSDEMDITDIASPENDSVKRKYYAVRKMIERLEWARQNEGFGRQREARRALHEAGFDLWLERHNMSRQEYRYVMNEELKKRGLRPIFRN